MEIKTRSILMFFIFFSPLVSLSQDKGFRVDLSHIDSKENFSKTELIRRAMIRTGHRVSRLNGMQLYSSANITTSISSGSETNLGEYYMDLAIGTPALRYSAIADTGSDLIWTQCNPCENCVYQSTPIYTPSNSSTFFPLCNSTESCSYNYTYGAGWTSGVKDLETFTFGTINSIQAINVTFGCSTSTSTNFNGSSGLVGLGRGELSLISQLNLGKFSYCLTSFLNQSNTSPLLLGPLATFNGSAVKSTPFVSSPQSSYYYLSLNGISLGATKLAITNTTFALTSNGTGGIIIDSGTTFTHLKTEAYQAVVDGIKSIVKLQIANESGTSFDLCYSLSNGASPPAMPNMTFHFDGADMELPVDNYMLLLDDLWCLAMTTSEGLSVPDTISIFGNYQQQNMHILYNLEKEVLSFSPAQCDSL